MSIQEQLLKVKSLLPADNEALQSVVTELTAIVDKLTEQSAALEATKKGLDERAKALEEKEREFTEKTKDVKVKIDAWEGIEKKFAESAAKIPSLVHLNVGKSLFHFYIPLIIYLASHNYFSLFIFVICRRKKIYFAKGRSATTQRIIL